MTEFETYRVKVRVETEPFAWRMLWVTRTVASPDDINHKKTFSTQRGTTEADARANHAVACQDYAGWVRAWRDGMLMDLCKWCVGGGS